MFSWEAEASNQTLKVEMLDARVIAGHKSYQALSDELECTEVERDALAVKLAELGQRLADAEAAVADKCHRQDLTQSALASASTSFEGHAMATAERRRLTP